MVKRLIVVGGPMGVGKSTVCRGLLQRLDRAVWLDGDWCWMMHPWLITAQNRRMVEDNIVHLLRSFLVNDSFDYVLFSWVLHRQEIADALLARLDGLAYDLHAFSLVCTPGELRERVLADGRDDDAVHRSLDRLACYPHLSATLVDTTGLGSEVVVEKLLGLAGLRPSV